MLTNWLYGAGNITPNILGQLKAVKKAARKLTGYPITHAFYGMNIPGYVANDPVLQTIIRGSQRVAEEAITAEIPSSVGNLKWMPLDQAFFVDQNGTARTGPATNTIVFTPDPSTDWWEIIEGTYPVPRSRSNWPATWARCWATSSRWQARSATPRSPPIRSPCSTSPATRSCRPEEPGGDLHRHGANELRNGNSQNILGDAT